MIVSASGCGQSHHAVSQAPQEIVGPRVTIGSGEVQVGFASGTLRNTETLVSFDISKYPVTRAQILACRNARACPSLGGETTDGAGSAQANGAPHETARAYCGWVGGRLPTLPEWLLAARGPNVQRFSWGEAAPTCEQHPRATHQRESSNVAEQPPARSANEAWDPSAAVIDRGPPRPVASSLEDCANAEERWLVGRHPAGAAPGGAEDFLLAGGELVEKTERSLFGACRGSDAGCVVSGITPGAIDSVAPLDSERVGEPMEPSYGFRCVWSGTPK